MFILNDLSPDHVLRNSPLADIGAEYKWMENDCKAWRPVSTGAPKIAKNTYNELGLAWTEHTLWRTTG